MKKFTIIMLMALLALPMMAQKTAATKAADIREQMGRVDNQATVIPIKAFDGTLRAAPKNEGGETILWNFDTDDALEGWTVIDSDGDGENWVVRDDYAHSTPQALTSYSYLNTVAYDPDNWLISPKVNLDGVLSIWAMNYSSYFADKIGIYVCVGDFETVDDFVPLNASVVPPTSWTEYTFDLTDYAGQAGYFAIRHYDCADNMRLYVDDISLQPAAGPEIAVPENLTVIPAATTADVAWEDSESEAWNLRYRPLVQGGEENLLWEFEEDTEDNSKTELTGGWTCIDADGDGNEWYHLTGENFNNHNGIGHVTSASYMGGALTPDNWLVSPQVKLDGTLSFWAAGQDASYADEVFTVYVSTGDPTDVSSFTAISQDLTATGEMTEYTFDLSSYAGQMGYVAIRHHDVTDMFRLNVDDIAIIYVAEAEWVEVNGLDATNYTITDLTPETTYEVQVQGTDATRAVSPWTESVVFTTLADDLTGVDQVMLGKAVAGKRYYNLAGQQVTRPEGATIIVTTYTDGTISAAQVIK